jgi:predicted lysophospholipase L1 biosynthesis ABC-type transport system permease subunit
MKKYLHIAAKLIFSLILLMPVLGATEIFPEATRDLYNTDQAFAFIQMLTTASYIMYMMAVVHILAIIALWTRREVVGALLALPITLNVVGFHFWLDGGLLTAGASMGNVMLALNLYLLYIHRDKLRTLAQQD